MPLSPIEPLARPRRGPAAQGQRATVAVSPGWRRAAGTGTSREVQGRTTGARGPQLRPVPTCLHRGVRSGSRDGARRLPACSALGPYRERVLPHGWGRGSAGAGAGGGGRCAPPVQRGDGAPQPLPHSPAGRNVAVRSGSSCSPATRMPPDHGGGVMTSALPPDRHLVDGGAVPARASSGQREADQVARHAPRGPDRGVDQRGRRAGVRRGRAPGVLPAGASPPPAARVRWCQAGRYRR